MTLPGTSSTDHAWVEILTLYVCPSIGCVLSALMFLSPVADLIRATRLGQLGHLPTLPWAVGLANCVGWTAYGYWKQDVFVMGSNVPGLLLSVFLNLGAIKLQYYALWQDHAAASKVFSSDKALSKLETATLQTDYDSINNNTDTDASVSSLLSTNKSTDSSTFLPTSGLVDQERVLYPLLFFWMSILVYVGWFAPQTEATTMAVGVLCNLNLVFFYGVPVQILRKVIATKDCSAIHRPTLCMTAANASFWMIYGLEVHNPVIWAPNALGAALGVAQTLALLVYPTRRTPSAKTVAMEGQAILQAVVENLDEQIYEPLTPKITSRKELREQVHPVEVLVPTPIRSAMVI